MKTDYELLRDRVAHRYGIDQRDVDWLRLHSNAVDIYKALKFLLAFYEPYAGKYLDTEAWKRAHAQALRAVTNYNGPASGARGEAGACDTGTPQSTGASLVCVNPVKCQEECEDVDGVNYCLRCGLWEGCRAGLTHRRPGSHARRVAKDGSATSAADAGADDNTVPCVCCVNDGLVREWVQKARAVAREKGYKVGTDRRK